MNYFTIRASTVSLAHTGVAVCFCVSRTPRVAHVVVGTGFCIQHHHGVQENFFRFLQVVYLCEGISLSVSGVAVVVTLLESTDNAILSTRSFTCHVPKWRLLSAVFPIRRRMRVVYDPTFDISAISFP